MNEIILGNQQKEALDLILKFKDSKEICFTLKGYAGCGKTMLTKYLIDELDKNWENYTICAPTHKAKIVIERFTGKEGFTLHKLLSLSPNIQIMDLDLNDLKFLIPKKSQLFPMNSLIICDEASMVNDFLYDLMVDRCQKNNCKIVWICDEAQIKPVNSIALSKVFQVKNSYQLTEIFRQKEGSALADLLFKNRTEFIDSFNTSLSKHGSIYVSSQPKDFLKSSLDNFKIGIDNKDIMETKVLSYTNERVNIFNNTIHKHLLGDKEYFIGEFLTCYDSFEFNYCQFWNGMDYIVTEEPIEKTIYIPNVGEFPGYELTVYDTLEDQNVTFNILSKSLTYKQIQNITGMIETIRLDAIEAKKYKSKQSKDLWMMYYQMMNSFTTPFDMYHDNRLIRKKTFDYGYALTLHRSQGSSINNTFIDMRSIGMCRDELEKRQLQYVALSRTRNNVNILQ